MAARKHIARAGLLLAAALLTGCSGGGDGSTPLSDAERLVGAALLPPDAEAGAAETLASDDLPPDAAASGTVDDDELPPAG